MSNTVSINGKPKIEIYSTGICPYCMWAKKLLLKKGVEFLDYRVDQESGLREEMIERSQRTSVPQIFIDDKHVGGYDEISKLDVDSELDKMLGLV